MSAVNDGLFIFKDRFGNEWDVTLTLGGARRIEASDFSAIYDKKISFVNPDKEFLTEVITNPGLTFAMIWALVKPQADQKQIDESQFLEAMNGDAVKQGKYTFWESLANFFQEKETALLRLIQQYKSAETMIADKMKEMEPRVMKGAKKLIDQEMEKAAAALESQIGEQSTESLAPSN